MSVSIQAYTVELLFANNAQTTLAGSISNTATAANLASGSGVLFPAPGAGQGYVGTFTDAATGLLREVVLVTQMTGDNISIMQRAQEGTTGLNWLANDLFGELWTAGQATSLVQAVQAQDQSYNYGVDTGSANNLLAAFSPSISSAPSPGTPFRVKIANSNTGATTANFGWGSVEVIRRDGSSLIGNELIGTQGAQFMWDGTDLEWQGAAPATSAAVTGGTDTQSFITPAQLSNASFAPLSSMAPFAGLVPPSGWLFAFGQAINRTTFATLFAAITAASNVTMTIATPCVITWPTHGLVAGDIVSFETTGALPTGLSIATNYYVVSPTTNTFEVAATPGGSPIATSGTQSGTQTCRHNPFGCGNGTTTFNVPDARGNFLFGNDYMGGTASGRLTLAASGVNPVLGGTGGGQVSSGATDVAGTNSSSASDASRGLMAAHNHTITNFPTVPPALGINMIIKT